MKIIDEIEITDTVLVDGVVEVRGRVVRSHEEGPETCHVRDGDYGECTLPLNHGNGSKIHAERRDGKLWAEWRSVVWEDECVCHARPERCPVHPRAELTE